MTKQISHQEGWCISNDSNGNPEIQKLDELDVFASDDDALAFVTGKANAGSNYHKQALAQL